jgi:hypothetical protein
MECFGHSGSIEKTGNFAISTVLNDLALFSHTHINMEFRASVHEKYCPVARHLSGERKVIVRSSAICRESGKLFFSQRTVGGRAENYFSVSGQSATAYFTIPLYYIRKSNILLTE